MSATSESSALVVFSGGMDSTVALYWARTKFADVATLSFTYGSRHNAQEHSHALKTCAKLGIKNTLINLDFIGQHFTSSLLGDGEIPQADYAPENLRSTVVPFRNGIMLAVAAGFAEQYGYQTVIIGNHGGDHAIYPDCRPEFITGMNSAVRAGTDAKVAILAPFSDWTKTAIAKLGRQLDVDFSLTYSCYAGGAVPCGVCATCRERDAALRDSAE